MKPCGSRLQSRDISIAGGAVISVSARRGQEVVGILESATLIMDETRTGILFEFENKLAFRTSSDKVKF